MYGQILPEHIEAGLVAGYHCPGCGRAEGWFQLHFPRLRLVNRGNCVEILYPVQCACGRRGHSCTTLPVLLNGYLLARIQMLESAKVKRQPKQTRPRRSEMLDRFIREFEAAMRDYASVSSAIEGCQPAQPPNERKRQFGEPTELDRLSFGFSDRTWQEFLRKMGLDNDQQQNDEH